MGGSAATLALIGCGHIGGSLALAWRQAGRVGRVIGVDVDPAAAARARELGVIDDVGAEVVEAVRAGAGLFVLAVPVRQVGAVARELAAALPVVAAGGGGGPIVTDVASLKARAVREAEAALAGRARFVGGHPMAGTARRGPEAADAGLFRGRPVVLTPTAATDAAALAEIAASWVAAGARVVELEAAAHDRAVAAVSHLPHAVAYALAAALGGEGVELYGEIAGPSLDSGTRVAGSEPAAWVEILGENREALLEWIDCFGARLGELRAALAAGDDAALERVLALGRAARAKLVRS